MKALILNSGMGTRMGVLTSEQPKCMTEIYGNQTILERQLRQLCDYGIREVVITTGMYDSLLKEYVQMMNLPISVSFVKNEEFKETNYIYSIYCAREYLCDDIVLIHGDLVFENEVLDQVLSYSNSCMVVSSTSPLPQKDFKAVIENERITKVGIDFFNDSLAAQPLYKISKEDWLAWLNKIVDYCECGDLNMRKVYAENAFNEVSNECHIFPLDIKDMLCCEIDTPEDLAVVSELAKKIEQRTVYVSFSTDMVHSGHIALIKKASRLGKLIIGVISDDVVASYKRYPSLPYEERKVLFENIKGVSEVVKQNTLSYKENIEKYHPAFVVHGDDWKEGFQKPVRDEVLELLASYGGRLVEFPYANDPKYKRIERQNASVQKMLYIEGKYSVLDDYLQASNIKRMMLVCGNNVKYHPLYKHICDLHSSMGIKVVEFSDFSPNPQYESVCAGVDVFSREKCDSILALGGGSTMDVTKCIKMFATMDPDKNYLEQRIEENNIPIMAIPTTAGTGSEVTRYSVIYYKGVKQSITHESCIPEMVFVDSSFLKTVPMYYRRATMLDALCHGIESFWSVNSTDESKAYAKEAIKMILEYKESYLANEDKGNTAMQRASQLAGQAINITQTTAGHAMCYMLTSTFGVAHGFAAALCVCELWEYMLDHTADCIDRRGENYLKSSLQELAIVFGTDTSKEANESFERILKKLFLDEYKKCDIQGCSKEECIQVLVDNVNVDRLNNCPIRLENGIIKTLYENIINKYLV